MKEIITSGTKEEVLEYPTWENPIRGYFDKYKNCMKFKFDLGNYEDVKKNAYNILERLNPQKGCNGQYLVDIMPHGGGWPSEIGKDGTRDPNGYREIRVTNFRRWIEHGFPEKATTESPKKTNVVQKRVRKNMKDLTHDELETLKAAFRVIKDLPPNDPHSFFYLASIHGTPNSKIWCRHHDSAFLPWHRWYTILMEEALRSTGVNGSENLTMPYWDQSEKIDLNDEKSGPPEWLWQEPFDSFNFKKYFEKYKDLFKFDKFVLEGFGNQPTIERGTEAFPTTLRLTRDLTRKQLYNYYLKDFSLSDEFSKANKAFYFETFADWNYVDCSDEQKNNSGVEHPHDHIHHLLGDLVPGKLYPEAKDLGDMLFQELTAFDPIFWFTHCDFDRNLWNWQKRWDATNKLSIQKTFKYFFKSTTYLKDPLNFNYTYFDQETFYTKVFEELADLNYVDISVPTKDIPKPNPKYVSIDYEEKKVVVTPFISKPIFFEKFDNSLTTRHTTGNSISVQDIDLSQYRGSVIVKLFAGKTLVDQKFVLLAWNQEKCENCRKRLPSNFIFTSLNTNDEYTVEVWSAITGRKIEKTPILKSIHIASTFN